MIKLTREERKEVVLDFMKKKRELLNSVGRTADACFGVLCRECPFNINGSDRICSCNTDESYSKIFDIVEDKILTPKLKEVSYDVWESVLVDTPILVGHSRYSTPRKGLFKGAYYDKDTNKGVVVTKSGGKTEFWEYACINLTDMRGRENE